MKANKIQQKMFEIKNVIQSFHFMVFKLFQCQGCQVFSFLFLTIQGSFYIFLQLLQFPLMGKFNAEYVCYMFSMKSFKIFTCKALLYPVFKSIIEVDLTFNIYYLPHKYYIFSCDYSSFYNGKSFQLIQQVLKTWEWNKS